MLLKTVEDEEAPCSYCHPSPEFITPSLPQDSSGPWQLALNHLHRTRRDV